MADEDTTLTEEQRIAQLEKKVSSNKVILFAVGLVLTISISVFVTSFVVSLMKDDVALVDLAAFEALSAQVDDLKDAINDKNAQIARLEQSVPQLKGMLDNSSAAALQQIALEQEINNQRFLDALQGGMKDLAFMMPGSRTWYELYSEKIASALASSQTREQKLRQMQGGSPASQGAELEF